MDDDTPQAIWHWSYWIALVFGAVFWVALWYGVGAALYFILSLR